MHGMCYYDVYPNTIRYQVGWKFVVVFVAVFGCPIACSLTSSILWRSLHFLSIQNIDGFVSRIAFIENSHPHATMFPHFFPWLFLHGIWFGRCCLLNYLCLLISVPYISFLFEERQTDYLIKVSTTFWVWFIDFVYPLFKLKKEKFLFGIYVRLVLLLLDVRSWNRRKYHIQGRCERKKEASVWYR